MTIGRNELDQLKDYVDFARDLQGNDPVGRRKVEGFVIGKELADSRKAQREYERMEQDDMYVRTYSNIRNMARKSHREFLDVLERKAERTDSEMLQLYVNELEEPGIDEQEQAM